MTRKQDKHTKDFRYIQKCKIKTKQRTKTRWCAKKIYEV